MTFERFRKIDPLPILSRVMNPNYNDIAELLEELAISHDLIAQLLIKKSDCTNLERNILLAVASTVDAEACRRTASAIRLEHQSHC